MNSLVCRRRYLVACSLYILAASCIAFIFVSLAAVTPPIDSTTYMW